MKKIISLFLVAIMVLTFVACGKDKSTNDTTEATNNNNKPAATVARDDSFVTGDLVLNIGEAIPSDKLTTVLGEPLDKQSAPSCHYDGNDTIYIYDGIVIYTYADGDSEIVYLVELSSDTYTAKGDTKVGMTADEVKAILGTPTQETAVSLVYEVSDTTAIRFTLADSVVSMIEYEEVI